MNKDSADRVKQDRGVKGLVETGHASTSRRSHGGHGKMHRRFCGLGLKSQDGQVYRFGPQNQERVRCGRIAKAEGTLPSRSLG